MENFTITNTVNTGRLCLEQKSQAGYVAQSNWSEINCANRSGPDIFGNDSMPMMEEYIGPFDYMPTRVIFICLYSVVFSSCFIGNLLVILVILKHRKMRSITNFFLANLALADFCVGIFCVLPNLSKQLSPYWHLGRVMCKLHMFVQTMSYTASITILTVISVERYFAIIHPIKSKQVTTLCMLRGVIICVWVFAAASGAPYLVIYDLVEIPAGVETIKFCMLSPTLTFDTKAYHTVSLVVWYILPLLLMTIMYTRISVVLWKSSKSDSCGIRMTSPTVSSATAAKLKAAQCSRLKPSKLRSGSRNCVVALYSRAPCSAEEAAVLAPVVVNTHQPTSSSEETGNETTHNTLNTSAQVRLLTQPSDIQDLETDVAADYEDDWPSAEMRTSKKKKNTEPHNTSNSPNRQKNITISKSNLLEPIKSPNLKVRDIRKRSRPGNALIARRRVIRLLLAVIFSFAMCVLPYHIRSMWMTWSTNHTFSFAQNLIPPVVFVIYFCNSGLNPILYAFLSANFKKCLREVVTCTENRRQQNMKSSFCSMTMTNASKSTAL